MKFFPFENIIYESRLKPEEIVRRIDEIIEPKKIFRMKGIFASHDHKPYEGSVSENEFAINRIVRNKNSFIPMIKGSIEKEFIGTRIKVKMMPHILVIVFVTIWFGALGFGCIVALFTLFGGEKADPSVFIPFGMFLVVYIVIMAAFKYESVKSKKYLAQLFEAEMIEQQGFK